MIQSLLHISVEPTELIAGTRFLFYFVQIVCMTWMGIYVGLHA